ncbi:hypothetical protein QF000_007504 [Paraburkholderia atlantica]|uniref:Uncharacterized protein n=1 Tax=Paraburkholderia atlantica TaxID=2654982 RepID=A0A7W8Q8J1_PARAM|nr:hypothetical protein [Paraburkholderia atlantica]MBB5418426.1 hypothetical protein [Paraburkholderia atlantica]MBB5425253.1 hypothetical protein [Paraburkholderia atlantica]NUY31992.1 hypothetical protein [Paraburkholderia atlantica]
MHKLILVPGQHDCRPVNKRETCADGRRNDAKNSTERQPGYQTGAHSVDGDELNKNGAAGSTEASANVGAGREKRYFT